MNRSTRIFITKILVILGLVAALSPLRVSAVAAQSSRDTNSGLLGGLIETVADPLTPITDPVTDVVDDVVEPVAPIVEPVVETVVEPVAPVVDAVVEPVAPIVDERGRTRQRSGSRACHGHGRRSCRDSC
ncbi:MAG: hypothetical protein QM753_04410 [Thermomicrobiales bacterium]